MGREEGRAREQVVFNFLKMALCIGSSRPSQEPNPLSLQRKVSLFQDEFCEQIVMFISVFNQLDAQNLFHNKFYFMPLHVLSTCARNM